MGAHTCLSCGLRTGRPDLHPTCNGEPPPWEVCTCGSGGHPRWCDLHPGTWDEHVRAINVEDAEDPEEAVLSWEDSCIRREAHVTAALSGGAIVETGASTRAALYRLGILHTPEGKALVQRTAEHWGLRFARTVA